MIMKILVVGALAWCLASGAMDTPDSTRSSTTDVSSLVNRDSSPPNRPGTPLQQMGEERRRRPPQIDLERAAENRNFEQQEQAYQQRCCTTTNCLLGCLCLMNSVSLAWNALNTWTNQHRSAHTTTPPVAGQKIE